MGKRISQRELRNRSGAIMRALDRGEQFVITRNGVPVGELRPVRRQLVGRAAFVSAMSEAPPIDRRRFRQDVDRLLDQTIQPRS